jgi:hypothetical protein
MCAGALPPCPRRGSAPPTDPPENCAAPGILLASRTPAPRRAADAGTREEAKPAGVSTSNGAHAGGADVPAVAAPPTGPGMSGAGRMPEGSGESTTPRRGPGQSPVRATMT